MAVLTVRRKAKIPAKTHEVKEGKSDDDLRCKRLFTVCQRRRGLSDDETKTGVVFYLEM